MKVNCSPQVSTRLKFIELQYRSVGFKVAVDGAGDQFLTLENINYKDYNHVFKPGYKDTFVKYNGPLTLENE